MIGAILGDIIGSPYEFDRGSKTKDFPLFSGRSEFTDDTVMTIAVADAFLPIQPDISTVLFDNYSEVIHDRVALGAVPKLTEKEYYVRGCTALLDAVGGAIHHIGNVHKYAREEDRPEKTLFVITTDGMENASHHYSYEKVKDMITRQKEKYGWEFLFLGVNIDAAREAARFGIDADRAANYHADAMGTEVIYEAVCETVCDFRASRPMAAGWKKRIDEDFKKRGR